MGFWPIAALIFGGALVAGLATPRPKVAKRPEQVSEADNEPDYELDGSPVDSEMLARLGTPETVAELVAQGHGDELRGLGYQGQLPPRQ